jgi:hypothetical protein
VLAPLADNGGPKNEAALAHNSKQQGMRVFSRRAFSARSHGTTRLVRRVPLLPIAAGFSLGFGIVQSEAVQPQLAAQRRTSPIKQEKKGQYLC